MEMPDIGLQDDPSINEVDGKFKPGSHIKLFIPNLPYLAISHAINAALLRPANNEKGWQYDLAVSHKNIDNKIWEFELRQDAYFQDGSHFNADDVLRNMKYFQKKPFTFTKLHTIFSHVEKIDDYKVRFHLTEPYGVFPHDAVWLQFYTNEYLEKFGWNGKPTCPNLAEPGPYALGPYELVKGYIEGDRSAPEVVLKANPNYWGHNKPKVETITIYTNITAVQATELINNREGEIDLTSIPFSSQVDTVLSKYAKLSLASSLNNYAMHFNMLNGNKAIKDPKIRFVINHAINQNYLLNLSMLGEGVPSPTTVSPNFFKVGDALNSLEAFFTGYKYKNDTSITNLRNIVKDYQKKNGQDAKAKLEISVLTQESFLFLLEDIKYFLAKVNITLNIKTLPEEKDVFKQLFNTWTDTNEHEWDLLLWGNYDWYKHPWAAFFVYKPFNSWSTIPPNEELDALTDEIVRYNVESEDYVNILAKFIRYVYENNLMVFLPTPNKVYAVNKEVVFEPGKSAFIYLRDLEVTDNHWSVRKDKVYPEQRFQPYKINRRKNQEVVYDY